MGEAKAPARPPPPPGLSGRRGHAHAHRVSGGSVRGRWPGPRWFTFVLRALSMSADMAGVRVTSRGGPQAVCQEEKRTCRPGPAPPRACGGTVRPAARGAGSASLALREPAFPRGGQTAQRAATWGRPTHQEGFHPGFSGPIDCLITTTFPGSARTPCPAL